MVVRVCDRLSESECVYTHKELYSGLFHCFQVTGENKQKHSKEDYKNLNSLCVDIDICIFISRMVQSAKMEG